jgi:hypothetical protein
LPKIANSSDENQTVETVLDLSRLAITGLKPGVNERRYHCTKSSKAIA